MTKAEEQARFRKEMQDSLIEWTNYLNLKYGEQSQRIAELLRRSQETILRAEDVIKSTQKN